MKITHKRGYQECRMEEKGISPFVYLVAIKGDYPMDVVLRAAGGIL